MANTVAGIVGNLKRLSKTISDKPTMLAVQDVENKILEIDTRLSDIERRLKAGGL